MPTPFRPAVATLAVALAFAAGCSNGRDDGPRRSADDAAPAQNVEQATDRAEPAPAADVPAKRAFACDGGHRVAVAGDDAVVTLADGRTVHVPRDADAPSRFHGEALSFRLVDGGGELAQEEVGVFHCRAG